MARRAFSYLPTAHKAGLCVMFAPHTHNTLQCTTMYTPIIATLTIIILAPLVTLIWKRFTHRRTIRRHFTNPRRQEAIIINPSGQGVVIDGDDEGATLRSYVELTAAPFQFTRTDLGAPPVPLDIINEHLVDHNPAATTITSISFGLVTASKDAYCQTYQNTLPEGTFSLARTIIEVSIDLKSSLHDITRRMDTDETDEGYNLIQGATRTLRVIAQQLKDSLNRGGFDAQIMNAAAITGFHNAVNYYLNDGLKNETWSSLAGDAGAPSACTLTHTTPDIPETLLNERNNRAVITTRLATVHHNVVDINAATTIVRDVNRDFPDPDKTMGYEPGQQGDLAARALPLAHTPTTLTDRTYSTNPHAPIESRFPTTGLGIRVGIEAIQSDDGGLEPGTQDVHLNLTGTHGKILHLVAPEPAVWTILMRLAATGDTVHVVTTDPMKTATINEDINLPNLKVEGTQGSTVSVFFGTGNAKPAQSRTTIVVTDNPPKTAEAVLRINPNPEGGNWPGVLYTRGGATGFFFTVDSAEVPFIPGFSQN